MLSQSLINRLAGIRQALLGAHRSGAAMSSASKGREREAFLQEYLEKVFPRTFRFGSGDVLDCDGNQSGQLDIVVEFPFMPGLPSTAGDARLYIAESVATTIEVKSNLSKQWSEVVATSKKLAKLKRVFEPSGLTPYGPPSARIPFFAVGYEGPSKLDTVKKWANSGVVDGVLVIESGLFSTRDGFEIAGTTGFFTEGDIALWGFICCIHRAATAIVANSRSPIHYLL